MEAMWLFSQHVQGEPDPKQAFGGGKGGHLCFSDRNCPVDATHPQYFLLEQTNLPEELILNSSDALDIKASLTDPRKLTSRKELHTNLISKKASWNTDHHGYRDGNDQD